MTRIWERLWIGDLTDANKLADENPGGIATVISLCQLAVHTKRWDINYLHLPIEDNTPIPIKQFQSVTDAISERIQWGRVLLHCNQGWSRAPSLAAAYMHKVGFKNLGAALDEIRRVCPIVSPSEVLLESLRKHLAGSIWQEAVSPSHG